MKHYAIRRIRLAHCKRGPSICEKCREMDEERICLLELFPPGTSLLQRRTIEVTVNGEKTWLEFDVARTFESEEEARAYASENGIEDVQLGD